MEDNEDFRPNPKEKERNETGITKSTGEGNGEDTPRYPPDE